MAVRWWLAAPTALKRAHENSKKQLKIRKNCAVSSSLVEPITCSCKYVCVLEVNTVYISSEDQRKFFEGFEVLTSF